MARPSRPEQAGAAGAECNIEWFRKETCAVFANDGKCLHLSANWQNLTGYTGAQSLGKKFIPLLRKTDQRKFLSFLAAPHRDKNLRFCLHHSDSHWEWFEITDWKQDAEGNLVLLLHRITDEIQKDSALQKASIEAELALRGQSEFFAHISHELRTPLNAILGFTQMMHQGMFGEVSNPRYSDYLRIMERSGQDLLGKINDLLEISSLCAGIDHLNEKNIPLSELMKNVIDIHSRELFLRRIQVDVDMLPVTLIGDRIKLQQAFSHLLRNAVKFSPEDTMIRLFTYRSDDGKLCISLSDEGGGFSDDQLDYFRDRNGRQFSFLERNRKLLGFGLPLAEELIRLHGGTIACRNLAKGGAEVTITLPSSRVIAITHETTTATRPLRKSSTKPPLTPLQTISRNDSASLSSV